MNCLFSRLTESASAVSPHGRCSRTPTRPPPTPSAAPQHLPSRPVPPHATARAGCLGATNCCDGRGGSRDCRPVQRECVPCNVHATAITPPQPAVPLPCYEAHPAGTYQHSGGRGGSQERRVTRLYGGITFEAVQHQLSVQLFWPRRAGRPRSHRGALSPGGKAGRSRRSSLTPSPSGMGRPTGRAPPPPRAPRSSRIAAVAESVGRARERAGADAEPPGTRQTCRWRSRPRGSGARARSRRPPSRR